MGWLSDPEGFNPDDPENDPDLCGFCGELVSCVAGAIWDKDRECWFCDGDCAGHVAEEEAA